METAAPEGEFAGFTAQVADLCALDVRAAADGSLLQLAVAVEAARSRLDALQARVLAELDARGTTEAVDGLKTKPWLAREANVSPRTVGARLKVGKVLRQSLPGTEAAVAAGRISFDHAAVLANRCNDRNADALAEIEEHLIGEARFLSFRKWENLVANVAATLDEDGSYDPDADLERNVLSMNVVGDELVVAAALVGDARVIVQQTIDHFADVLFRRSRDDQRRSGAAPPSRRVLQALAVVEICRRARAVDLDSSRAPETEAVVVIDGSQLGADEPEVADVEGAPLQTPGRPTHSVLKLMCSASLAAVVVNSLGLPTDHGRAIRNVTAAQKRLLRVRDGGCTFPGCDRPHSWTDAHHIILWNDQGGTDIDNLVSLCRYHHGVVHRSGWGVRLSDDGWAIFSRPGGVWFWGQRHGQQRAGPATPLAA